MGWLFRKRRPQPGPLPVNPKLNPQKTELIDFACGTLGARSLADLGAVWTVDGGYCTHAIERYGVDPAIAVDAYPSEALMEQAARCPQLRVVNGNFGDPAVAGRIGKVDLVVLFDVLIVQVHPDWDEILEMYAPLTRMFAIFNPQFLVPKSVRLMELPEAEYFSMVPHSRDQEPYKTAFDRLDEMHPDQGRRYRDSFDLWQWGITDADLVAKMQALGFRQQFTRNHGAFEHLKHAENHGFVFARQ